MKKLFSVIAIFACIICTGVFFAGCYVDKNEYADIGFEFKEAFEKRGYTVFMGKNVAEYEWSIYSVYAEPIYASLPWSSYNKNITGILDVRKGEDNALIIWFKSNNTAKLFKNDSRITLPSTQIMYCDLCYSATSGIAKEVRRILMWNDCLVFFGID